MDFMQKPTEASVSQTKISKPSKNNYELGNSTTAFTNFLASVYKTEIILDPIDVLA